ncbi:MAG: very short patch repair endonuclease [Thermotogota bacterium]|nr:very short patch repair endonuclease [Chloroflexota bacterium]MDY6896367.1 very short patch repair endonuclease [Thermotogota bacterium]
MDNLTKEQRSNNMRNIRSKGTKPEQKIMNELYQRNIDFTTYVKEITGKPDIVFTKEKVIVFIDSVFWHGHPEKFIMPKTNQNYWSKKIQRNKDRDKQVNELLSKKGWNVIRIWDCDIYHNLSGCLNEIFIALGRKDLIEED